MGHAEGEEEEEGVTEEAFVDANLSVCLFVHDGI